ncbi:MAG: hypothetical protein LBC61_05825 [Candidatus Peribacteria bacterium]|nr:hypothetical protein [Candidatus Peribacteria bacterium]
MYRYNLEHLEIFNKYLSTVTDEDLKRYKIFIRHFFEWFVYDRGKERDEAGSKPSDNPTEEVTKLVTDIV